MKERPALEAVLEISEAAFDQLGDNDFLNDTPVVGVGFKFCKAFCGIRERVLHARTIQQQRFAGRPKCRANAQMTHGLLKACCKLDSESNELLHRAMEELHLSARAYDRIFKVARTIADLARSGSIRPPHVLEAIQYRTLDRSLWH